MSWIAFTLFAAVMQAVRTAGQRQLSRHLSAMSTTLSRYLFGLPVAVFYLLGLARLQDLPLPGLTAAFLGWALVASIAQIAATWCLVSAFRFNNFAVGTTLAKTEALQTAFLGWLFFGLPLAGLDWLALIAGFLGIVVIGNPRKLLAEPKAWRSPALGFGLASGALFAVASLSLRTAAHELETDLTLAAAVTLVTMVLIQTLICVFWVGGTESQPWRKLWQHRKLAVFIGVTSALGSIGWFTAMALHNPALVKTLGQVEFFITLGITHWVFRERIHRHEGWGMAMVLLSVVLLLI